MLGKAAALFTAMRTWNTKSSQPPYRTHIAPFSTQSAHTHTLSHKYCIYALDWCLLLYGNDAETVQSLFHPLKGESNSPRVSQVWIARRHNVASRHPMDMVDRHMRCVSVINWFTLYCIGRAKSQERRTRNRKDQRQKSKSYLAYQQGKIRTKRVSGTIKHFKLREQLGTVIYPCRRI